VLGTTQCLPLAVLALLLPLSANALARATGDRCLATLPGALTQACVPSHILSSTGVSRLRLRRIDVQPSGVTGNHRNCNCSQQETERLQIVKSTPLQAGNGSWSAMRSGNIMRVHDFPPASVPHDHALLCTTLAATAPAFRACALGRQPVIGARGAHGVEVAEQILRTSGFPLERKVAQQAQRGLAVEIEARHKCLAGIIVRARRRSTR